MANLSNHGNQENVMLWLARPKSHIILGVGGGTALSEIWSEHGGKVVYLKKTGIPEGGRIDIGWQNTRRLLEESVPIMDNSTAFITLHTDYKPVPRMSLDSLCYHICCEHLLLSA